MARLLVIDDDADTRMILRRLLVRRGHAADCMAGGDEALAQLRAAPAGGLPDLVLLDLMLADRDGLDVLRELRAEPALARVKVVVYSAADEPGRADECRAAGANAYVVKGRGRVRRPDAADPPVPVSEETRAPAARTALGVGRARPDPARAGRVGAARVARRAVGLAPGGRRVRARRKAPSIQGSVGHPGAHLTRN
jgi:two-component system, OmpR family, phosphate regulon response regulator PhoB